MNPFAHCLIMPSIYLNGLQFIVLDMQPSIGTYVFKAQNYHFRASLEDEIIRLSLRVFEGDLKQCQNVLGQEHDVVKMIGLEETFQLFSQFSNFTVDPRKKQILLKFEFTVGKKAILKEYDIVLKEKDHERRIDRLEKELKELRKEVEGLKKGKREEAMETSDLEIQFEDNRKEELMRSPFITSTPFAHRFTFSGEKNQVATYTGKNKEWTQLLFKKAIEPGDTLRKFEFSILRCWKQKMKFGLVNLDRQRDCQTSCHNNALTYELFTLKLWYGTVYDRKRTEFIYSGYRPIEERNLKCQIEVNLKDGSVKFRVNKNGVDVEYPQLVNPTEQWTPYFQFYYQGDAVEWIYP